MTDRRLFEQVSCTFKKKTVTKETNTLITSETIDELLMNLEFYQSSLGNIRKTIKILALYNKNLKEKVQG